MGRTLIVGVVDGFANAQTMIDDLADALDDVDVIVLPGVVGMVFVDDPVVTTMHNHLTATDDRARAAAQSNGPGTVDVAADEVKPAARGRKTS